MASRHVPQPHAARSMWITWPAAVDNYRQRLLAVCGCPVDGVGTSDGVARPVVGKTASYPPEDTRGTPCFACHKCLNIKRFFHLSTETIHRYLLLLSVYIRKKVNQLIDLRRTYQRADSQPQIRTSSVSIDVIGSPRNVEPVRFCGTHMPRAVTKLTCRRCSHAGIMSPLEPSPGRSVVCFIYS
jgi:hypothetical protein